MLKGAGDRLRNALDRCDEAAAKADTQTRDAQEAQRKNGGLFAGLRESVIVPALEGVAETIRARGHGATVTQDAAYGVVTFEIDVRGEPGKVRPSLLFRPSGDVISVTTTGVDRRGGHANWTDNHRAHALTRDAVENMAVVLAEKALGAK